MNLFDLFIHKLKQAGYPTDSTRFFGAEDELKCRMSKIPIKDICRKYKINQGTFYYMKIGRRAIPYYILKDLSIDASNYMCIISGSNIQIKIPTELTEELAYLIGVLRDGTVVQENYGKYSEYCCAFYSKYKEFLKIIKNTIDKNFDIKTKIKKHGTIWCIRVRSMTMYLFFKLLFEIPQKQEYWATPKLIKKSNEKIIQAYISGFYDAEGSCPHFEESIKLKRKNLYISFVQKNKESLEFIKKYLEKRNIETTNIHPNKDKWVLKIKTHSILSFIKFIKSRHPIKIRRLERMLLFFLRTAGGQGYRCSLVKRGH